MPTDVAALTTFYAAAGYTFPTSIPIHSASLTGHLPSTEPQAAATHTPAKTPSVSGLTVPASSGTSNHSDKTGLRIGIGIGIGIGLSVIICGVCTILLYLYMRRRRHRQQLQPKQQGHMQNEDLASPAPILVHDGHSKELEGVCMISELEGLQEVYEMQGFNAKSP